MKSKADCGQDERKEIADLLTPFDDVGLLTARGHPLLAWARDEDDG